VQDLGLDDLFRRYSASVFRRARAILGDGDAAKDATQEVFLRAMNAQAELAAVRSPIAWLYRVTTNLCLTRIRDAERRGVLLRQSQPAAVPATESPIDVALTVRALLRNVPDDLQEIAVCYFVDRMSQDEIAELVGLPRRTVSYRLQQFITLARNLTNRGELAS
jgi:RNA polymerase sigma-70 factor (ECF subfamily)